MKKRYCHLGTNENGHPVFADAETGTDVRAFVGPAEGRTLISGRQLVLVEPEEDGKHVMLEDVDLGETGGPAQVATTAYRAGWDATFGAVSKAN